MTMYSGDMMTPDEKRTWLRNMLKMFRKACTAMQIDDDMLIHVATDFLTVVKLDSEKAKQRCPYYSSIGLRCRRTQHDDRDHIWVAESRSKSA